MNYSVPFNIVYIVSRGDIYRGKAYLSHDYLTPYLYLMFRKPM